MKFGFLKTRVTIVVIGLLLGLISGFKIANSQYRSEQGVSLKKAVAQASGQIPEVRSILEKAQNNPQDLEAQLDAADQFIKIGRPEEATQFLQQAVKIKPDDARSTAGLGMTNFMMGQYDEAITWCKRSLAISPKNPAASFLLVASNIRSGKNLDEAERLIQQLEADGMDQSLITKAREELKEVRSGKSAAPGSNAGSKTMLQHGPDEPKPPSGGSKTGGPR